MLQHNSIESAASWLHQCVTGELQTDSRHVRAGDGFVAWPGAAHDGRSYVAAALAQGAMACLLERKDIEYFDFANVHFSNQTSLASYEDLKAATGPIAATYFGQPSSKMHLVAFTGTNGKTTSAWWFSHLMASLKTTPGQCCGHIGTLGAGVVRNGSLEAVPTGLTTPDPVLLQKKLRDFVDAGVTFCALEASSIGLVEQRLTGTHLQTAVFTNFTQDHLDYHGSMDAYWEAKRMLFDWPCLKSAVINIDDKKGSELAQSLVPKSVQTGPDVWTISCKQPARLRASDITNGALGLAFTLVEGEQGFRVNSRIIGSYNLSNLLGVLAAARAGGVPLEQCALACMDLPSVPGRMEKFGGASAPLVIVDYAHTPDALQQVLAALRGVSDARTGRIICVFGCGGDRDRGKRRLMGQVAARLAETVVVTNDNPRNEDPSAIAQAILTGLQKHKDVHLELDRHLAVAGAIAGAKSGDVVLIAGKGHEQYQEVAGLRLAFSDQAEVQAALAVWVNFSPTVGATR